jgi:hypothetical protein
MEHGRACFVDIRTRRTPIAATPSSTVRTERSNMQCSFKKAKTKKTY